MPISISSALSRGKVKHNGIKTEAKNDAIQLQQGDGSISISLAAMYPLRDKVNFQN